MHQTLYAYKLNQRLQSEAIWLLLTMDKLQGYDSPLLVSRIAALRVPVHCEEEPVLVWRGEWGGGREDRLVPTDQKNDTIKINQPFQTHSQKS